jgi:hypothetical protein
MDKLECNLIKELKKLLYPNWLIKLKFSRNGVPMDKRILKKNRQIWKNYVSLALKKCREKIQFLT